MGLNMVSARSQPERELKAKRAELEGLQDQLAEKELELATVELTLQDFNRRYLDVVGAKYAQLDRIEAEIAERLAARNPLDHEQAQKATDARQRASETAASVDERPRMLALAPKPERLKKLYREAARQMHPDFADDAADRELRESYMAKANEAYSRGDETALRDLLDSWGSSPEAIRGSGMSADFERTVRRIAQLKKRLQEIEMRLAELKASELSQLFAKSKRAENQGKDFLQEMAQSVDTRVQYARERLQNL